LENQDTTNNYSGDYLDADLEKADILRKSYNLPFRAAPVRTSGEESVNFGDSQRKKNSKTMMNQSFDKSRMDDIHGSSTFGYQNVYQQKSLKDLQNASYL
jgi:hypothetical protein